MMNDLDRFKVLIYQTIFADEVQLDKKTEICLTQLNRRGTAEQRTEAAVNYIIALAMKTEFDLLSRKIFDIIKG